MSNRPVIDLSTQISRLRGIVASGVLGGITGTAAIGFATSAYQGWLNPMSSLVWAGFATLAALFFIAYAIGAGGRVITDMQELPQIINQLSAKVLAQDNVIISLRLRESMKTPQGREEADSAILSASVIPMTKLH